MAGLRTTSSRREKLVRAAKGLAGIDGESIALLWRLLVPYAERLSRALPARRPYLLRRLAGAGAQSGARPAPGARRIKKIVPDDPDRRISGHRSDPVRNSSLPGRTAPSDCGGMARSQIRARQTVRRRRSKTIDLCFSPRRYRGLFGSRRKNHHGAGRHRVPADHQLP